MARRSAAGQPRPGAARSDRAPVPIEIGTAADLVDVDGTTVSPVAPIFPDSVPRKLQTQAAYGPFTTKSHRVFLLLKLLV